MQRLNLSMDRFKKKPEKVLSERATLLKEFLDTLNADRKSPYKPLTPARLGAMLRFIKTKDLHAFLADCKYAPHFQKYFWYCYKVAKESKNVINSH